MADSQHQQDWQPTTHLECHKRHSALLILNQPITNIPIFERLWKHSEFRICADGGANSLYDIVGQAFAERKRDAYLPHEICGDLDSIRPEVRDYYRAHHVGIIHRPSQYATDFAKCVERIKQRHEEGAHTSGSDILDIAVLGGLGGRVDQGFSVMHQLYSMDEDDPSSSTIRLYSDRSISFILGPGCNRLFLPLAEGYLTENVGIIPVGRPAVITTSGLEWDVTNWTTEFGKQVSTSNHIKNDVVEVTTDARVLFTVEILEIIPACRCDPV